MKAPYVFGRSSQGEIDTLHPDYKLIHKTAIKTIPVDYGVHNGGRTFSLQLEYFLGGKSRLDPRKPGVLEKAKHVIYEGREKAEASDIHVSGKHKGESLTWNKDHLIFVAAYLIAVADMLYAQGLISHRLRWGGNWDMDGTIVIDQEFDDLPHLEMYKPE